METNGTLDLKPITTFDGPYDGDVLFVATFNRVEDELDGMTFGVFASELAWDAALSAVTTSNP